MNFAWASPDYINDRLTPKQIRELMDSLVKIRKRISPDSVTGDGRNVTVLEFKTEEANRKALQSLQHGVTGR